jgi:hypothetical protein
MCASISVHKRAQLAYRAAIQAHFCPAIAIAHAADVVGQNRSIRTTENDHPISFPPHLFLLPPSPQHNNPNFNSSLSFSNSLHQINLQ